MQPPSTADPKRFIADFFTSFNEELIRGDDEPAQVVDRYHTADIVQVADGRRMDREKLIAHVRPLRRNRPEGRIEVHEAIADGDRIAARYTLHVKIRGKELSIEVCFFGRFAPDGRMCDAHMLTRDVPQPDEGEEPA
ncbi:nuclear transport factor 2 family protein [Actinomadura sp. WMMB 499]|uniref:nuclear transport factor 2 family protein n=1 Tax=Actinomadura sp. WMMB 499 TaxID=1219491 RepID=UPI001243FAB1|nr:nuclear transport factor 2 family protein [Actinomadura sp. WMMB 499]QFG24537.1 nuclear transport factor 2 family protein [Actinomadura sp. WMMB 499]